MGNEERQKLVCEEKFSVSAGGVKSQYHIALTPSHKNVSDVTKYIEQ